MLSEALSFKLSTLYRLLFSCFAHSFSALDFRPLLGAVPGKCSRTSHQFSANHLHTPHIHMFTRNSHTITHTHTRR